MELTTPWQAVKDAGGEPVLLAPEKNTVQAVNHDTELAGTFEPDQAVSDASVEDFVVKGKTLTSWPSLQTDIRNAGGDWCDEQVFLCSRQGFDLVTSRKPDDLDAFGQQLVQTFAKVS
ncbi:MAG: DJ-1/PfpI family protein [Actinomycetota bacterium]|nr:DJ-1/PfpI family protein [Actinomycetota bacterium]